MSLLEQVASFVHVETQRTGYVTDGPFHDFDKSGAKLRNGRWPVLETHFACKWDDTGEDGDVALSEIKWIPSTSRHITDGIRICWCNPVITDGVIVHNTEEQQLN